MLVLGVHATSGGCFLALTGPVSGPVVSAHAQPSTALPGGALALLESAGKKLSDLDLLAVARGPGSFTGIKVSISCFWGLARATATRLVGIGSLDALAFLAPPGVSRVVAVATAYAGMVYAARFVLGPDRVPQPDSAPFVGRPHELAARLVGAQAVVAETGAVQLLPPDLPSPAAVRPGPDLAVAVASVAALVTASECPAQPLYLRADPTKAW